MAAKGEETLSIHELQNSDGAEDQYHKATSVKGGTAADSEDMRRMGRVQELRVGYVTGETFLDSDGSLTSATA